MITALAALGLGVLSLSVAAKDRYEVVKREVLMKAKSMSFESPARDEAQKAIWEKITTANEKWASGDPMGFLECAAKDIVWSDDLGAQNRVIGYDALNTYLEALKGQIPPHQHELIEPIFQFYDDIVIVSYRYQGIIGGEVNAPWKVTSAWRYADGEWLSVHENWTEIKK